MDITAAVLTILGLAVFESITSIDNAIINAEVLATMQARARRWFLTWGIAIAVFGVRGLLPWLIVWAMAPGLNPWQALTATFTDDPAAQKAIQDSAPVLLIGGGVFFIFLFCHWLFQEPKKFGLPGEDFFARQSHLDRHRVHVPADSLHFSQRSKPLKNRRLRKITGMDDKVHVSQRFQHRVWQFLHRSNVGISEYSESHDPAPSAGVMNKLLSPSHKGRPGNHRAPGGQGFF